MPPPPTPAGSTPPPGSSSPPHGRRQGDRVDADRFGPCKVVILAGGFGTRLAEHTDELPKPMVEVGGRPILWHILKIYSHFGFNDFVIAGGYRVDVIKRFFRDYRDQMSDLVFDYSRGTVDRINTHIEPWRVAVIDTGAETMTGGRLKRLQQQLGTRPFMMTYGDGVADIDVNALLAFHKSHGKLATFTAVRKPTSFGIPVLQGDRAVKFAEKPPGDSEWINGGFLVLEPAVVDRIPGDATNFELKTLSELAEGGELMAYRHTGFWQPMDTLRDVRLLNSLWSSADNPPWKVWSA